MPVLQIKAGMAIAPNHVYVIPPNQYLGLKGNVFTLSEAVAHSGLRLPVDAFFRSIAEQQASRAIAIIFSGTGSDGALGLRMVKASGGLVLAQAPETAEFDGMPSNAIATGMVDLICPISEMPGYLLGYFQHPYVGSNASNATDADPLGAQAEALDAILAVLQTHIGQDFRAYKKGTLQRRIRRGEAVVPGFAHRGDRFFPRSGGI
jgi:two-component system, chemotaxis family, CheB/CheR fusion protein